MEKNISHLAPTLAVREMDQALKFYNALGFNTEFLWQDPPSYAVLSAGEGASIHLSLLAPEDRDKKIKGVVYIFVHNVDALHEICVKNGYPIPSPLDNRDYGMRDFDVNDPDGNLLTFGKSLERIAS